MGIRTNSNKKDHLSENRVPLALVATPVTTDDADPLRFRTLHPTKPVIVDLNCFSCGTLKVTRKRASRFSGRPELIRELAPAIREHLMPLAQKSVAQHLHALRAWWKLFDAMETENPTLKALHSSSELSELHRIAAFNALDRLAFSNFLIHVNTTRAALGLKRLIWERPSAPEVSRKLPPQWQTDLLRRELKHAWFSVIDRWDLHDALLLNGQPSEEVSSVPIEEQLRLCRNYKLFDQVRKGGDAPRPTQKLLAQKVDVNFREAGISVLDMLQGCYPDGSDIRAALYCHYRVESSSSHRVGCGGKFYRGPP